MQHTEQGQKSSVEKEYAQLARVYDDKWSFYIEASLQETLKRIDVHSCQKLLDIGCGTGVLLETLRGKYPDIHLAGIDPTKEMLDIASKRLPKDIHIEQGWAESLAFEDTSFDIVVSCNMFHYIQKPVAALKEAMRVLKPTGMLVITDWCDDYIFCRICDLFLRFFNDAHFKTYRKHECYSLLSSSGFSDIKVDKYKINWFWGMMTAKAYKQAI